MFLSMPAGEIETAAVARCAFEQGKMVFIPYLRRNEAPAGPRSVMDMVELYSQDDFAQLKPDKWGIPSLESDALPGRRRTPGDHAGESSPSTLDLIVVPGVGFSRKMHRLGHGKGYYDFFLQRYREAVGGQAMPCLGMTPPLPISFPMLMLHSCASSTRASLA